MNDVIFKIFSVPDGKARVVPFNKLVLFKDDNNTRQELQSAQVSESSFENLWELTVALEKLDLELRSKGQRDLFTMSSKYDSVQCISRFGFKKRSCSYL